MQLNSIFSVDIGCASLVEHLPLARELFAENKDSLTPIPDNVGLKTSLKDYLSHATVNHQDSAKIDILKDAILGKGYEYAVALGYGDNVHKLKVDNLWFNEMESGSTHPAHAHYGPIISGCFYVDMPENCNPIKFSHPHLYLDTLHKMGINRFTQSNSTNWTVNPMEGDILLWKSDLQHEAPKAEFEGVRRSIAFDIVVVK